MLLKLKNLRNLFLFSCPVIWNSLAINLDGTGVTDVTIDGEQVQEITVDGSTVWSNVDVNQIETDATVSSGTSMSLTVYEDTTGDGTADNTETISVADGVNTYTLSNLDGSSGNTYWIEWQLNNQEINKSPEANSADLSNVGKWASSSDWNNSQSENNVNHPSNKVRLDLSAETWESYTSGSQPPSPWTCNKSPSVSETYAYEGSKSLHLNDTANAGEAHAYIDFDAAKYDYLEFYYYETSNNRVTAYSPSTSNGSNLFYAGTDNPQVTIEDGDGSTEMVSSPSPNYGVWRKMEFYIDWSTLTYDVIWKDVGGSTSNSSLSGRSLNAHSTNDIGRVGLTHGGTSGAWGGLNGDLDAWIDLPYARFQNGSLKTRTKTS